MVLNPDYVPVSPSRTNRSPSRRVVSDGRTAPQLLLTFVCPKCNREAVCDAYLGPVSCTDNHFPRFMEPKVIRPEIYHPPYVRPAVGKGGVTQ